jgi:protein-L-isoaspartate O-methyltransferase
MLAHLPSDFRRGTFVDYGAGMGFTAAAATDLFERVYAIEVNRNTINAMLPHFKAGSRITVVEDIGGVDEPIDALYLWHTVEHMADLLPQMKKAVRHLAPGGALFFQVPCYRDPYVIYPTTRF